jgi:dUTP pyrophosphatase
LHVLAGVIDSDYRGEVCCLLYNAGDETVELPRETKICQLIVERIILPAPIWVNDLDETPRGKGGFGSTG